MSAKAGVRRNARDILPPNQTYADVTDQLAGIPLHFPSRRRWLIALGISSALLGLLFVSATVLFTTGVGIWGLNIPVNWAFAIHNYVWWLGIGHAGTLISALLLLLGRDWRNSLNRFAETMTLFAVVCAGIYPILHLGRPWFFYWMFPYPATMSVWPQFRSPLEWDIWAVLTYLTVSIVFWYIGLVPDLAAARDRARRRRWKVFFGVLCLGWRGSAAHWMRWHQAYRLLAALAVPLVVSVHSEVSLLFAAGTIPGWHSTIFPPYFVLGAAFSGFAVVAMIAIVLRGLFHLHNLVTDDHLDALGKVLLACGLMTAYGYVFEVFDALYSGGGHEIQTLQDRFFGQYWWSYWGAIVFNFVVLQPLWWRVARRTPWMLFTISTSVAIGMWLERYMILVTSLYRDFLVSSWGEYHATFWDWAVYAGTIGLFLVPFLLIIRLLPVISIFETKEVLHEEHEEAAHG
ncbi:MAG: NrfD/PsrC family molybdoenzyme membrane anchor subunit [Pseudolabrys sp.]